MKVYFAPLDDLSFRPVDAHVTTNEEGASILDALRLQFAEQNVVLRARVKSGANYEGRFIGLGKDGGEFVETVRAGKLC